MASSLTVSFFLGLGSFSSSLRSKRRRVLPDEAGDEDLLGGGEDEGSNEFMGWRLRSERDRPDADNEGMWVLVDYTKCGIKEWI